MMLLLFGSFQMMLAVYSYHFVSSAAQQGSRFAAVRGYTWSKLQTTNCGTSAPPSFTMIYGCTAASTDIQNYVQSLATPGINPSNVTINETNSYVWPGKRPDNTTALCSGSYSPKSQMCLVQVTVSYTFNFLPFLKLTQLTMSATSEQAIQQ
jgi:hypothetical protein